MIINSREVKFKFLKLYNEPNPLLYVQEIIDSFYHSWHNNSKIKYYLNLVKDNNSFYNIKISIYSSLILEKPLGLLIFAEGNPKYDKLFELTILLVEEFLKQYKIEYLMIAPKERFMSGFDDLNYQLDEIYYELLDNSNDETAKQIAVNELHNIVRQFDFILSSMKLFDDKIIELIKQFSLKLQSLNTNHENKNFNYSKEKNTKIDYSDKEDLIKFFEKGTGYFDLGMYEEAIIEFEKILKRKQDNIQALLNIGWIYLISNKVDLSYNYFSKVLQIDNQNPNALNGLAVVCLRKKNYLDAKKYFNKSVELDSQSKNAYFAYNSLGEIFLKEHSIEDAMLNFEKAISINKEKIEAHLNLAHLYHYLGIYEHADNEYNMCLKLKPEDKKITISKLVNLAQKEISKDNLFEAEKIFKKILKFKIDDAEIFNRFGNVLFRLKKYKRAVVMYKKSIQLQNDFDKALYNLGVVYQKLMNFDKSKDYFFKVLNINPEDKYALNQIGWLEYIKCNYAVAIDYFLKAIKVDPDFLLPVINLGWIYVQDNELAKALQIYQSLFIKYPEHLLIKNDLAVVYYKLKIFDKSLQLFLEILNKTEFKKLKVLANYYVGLIYKQKGVIEKALEHFYNSYNLDDTHINTIKELKELYHQIGEKEKYDFFNHKLSVTKMNLNGRNILDKFDSRFEENLKL